MSNQEFLFNINLILSSNEMQSTKGHIQHGNVSVFAHCCAVALICYCIAIKVKRLNVTSLVKGALLHDFFLYDWHGCKLGQLHGFHHPRIAMQNSESVFGLTDLEKDIISKHMWPLTITRIPKTRESWVVCMVDKFCSLMETLKIFKYDNSLVDLFEQDLSGGFFKGTKTVKTFRKIKENA